MQDFLDVHNAAGGRQVAGTGQLPQGPQTGGRQFGGLGGPVDIDLAGLVQGPQTVLGPSASGVQDVGRQLADPIGTFAGGTNAQGFSPGRAAFEAIRQGGGLEALQGGAANAQGFTPLRAIMERLRAGGAFG
jgi:hypothetical protein